ncbi:MAG: hypothetical protein KGJ80_14330, partial [Chloroflexota bacterium]|nr:hypothetical protein [Chloroflexota bacterium]
MTTQIDAPITEINDAIDAGKIAVVGLSGRFPGAATIEQFWANLAAGVEARTTFTDATLAKHVSSDLWQNPAYVKTGFVLDQVDQFDADLFEFT